MTAQVDRLAAATLLALAMPGCGATAQSDTTADLLTRAERTDYEETTGYDEVVRFVERAAALSDHVHVTSFGTTVEGRSLPLVVVGDVPDVRPESVVAAGRVRVWLQANIHGGEVCGKEALLMLLRDVVTGAHEDWLSSLTLLVAPIYNADGNERMALDNRPYQLGPVGGMGTRRNAQELDLNRDHMKLESPEARALVRAYADYDPHVVIDLHTTNGTQHAYHLTYAPPLHPNTHPAMDALLRDEWLPAVTDAVRESNGWEFYHYGNVPRAEGAEPSWRTFDHRPRFNNNYVGLRNRIGLISEAYAYAPFEERVAATLGFVEESLAFAHDNADRIAALIAEADATPVAGRALATRAVPRRSPEPVRILLGRTEEVPHPETGEPLRRRIEVAEPTLMDEYVAFEAAEDGLEIAPASYYVPAELIPVVDLLAAHGVDADPLEADTAVSAEQFVVSGASLSERPFEGHYERTVEGAWEAVKRTLPAGRHAGGGGDAATRTPGVRAARAPFGRRGRELEPAGRAGRCGGDPSRPEGSGGTSCRAVSAEAAAPRLTARRKRGGLLPAATATARPPPTRRTATTVPALREWERWSRRRAPGAARCCTGSGRWRWGWRAASRRGRAA